MQPCSKRPLNRIQTKTSLLGVCAERDIHHLVWVEVRKKTTPAGPNDSQMIFGGVSLLMLGDPTCLVDAIQKLKYSQRGLLTRCSETQGRAGDPRRCKLGTPQSLVDAGGLDFFS